MAVWRHRRELTAGSAVAVGIFQTWLAADILLALAGYPFKRPGVLMWIVILIPVFTGLWSDDPLACVLWGWRIFALQSIVRTHAGKGIWFTAPALAGLLIQAGLAFGVWLDHRPLVFSLNSEVMAGIGFAAFGPGLIAVLASGLTMGVSGARLAPALMLLLAALMALGTVGRIRSRDRVLRVRVALRWGYASPALAAAVIAVSLFVIQTAAISPQRLTLATLKKDAAIRSDLVTLDDVRSVKQSIDIHRPDLSARPVEREWSVVGYGYRSYLESTAASTPHNIYVLAWYELGLLVIPFFLALGLLALRLPFPLIVCVGVYAAFVDLWYWHASGVYGLALLAYNWSNTGVGGADDVAHRAAQPTASEFDSHPGSPVSVNGSTVPSGNTAPLS